MDSFEEDERDYVNVNPCQQPSQPQLQPQGSAKAKPAASTQKAPEQRGCGRKSFGILLGVCLLLSTAAFVLTLLKWIPCCPQGWVEFQKKCYFLSPKKTFWVAAQNSCISYSAHLAVIRNQWEQAFLAGGINSTEHWIGLSVRDQESHWSWVDNSPVSYEYWPAGSPSVGTQKKCAHLTGEDRGVWKAEPCDTPYKYICERAGPLCT